MSKTKFWKFIETNGKDLTVDSLQSAKARIDRIVEWKVSAINVLGVKEGDRVLVLGASILEAGDNAPGIIGELKETGVRVLLPGEEYLLGRFGYDRLKRLSDEDTSPKFWPMRNAKSHTQNGNSPKPTVRRELLKFCDFSLNGEIRRDSESAPS